MAEKTCKRDRSRWNRYVVYALSDPDSGELRYIGKSHRGLSRLPSHMRDSRALAADGSHKFNGHVQRWIRTLGGRRPLIEEVEQCAGADECSDAERYWIAQFRALGVRLTNMTIGGDGKVGCPTSVETREKLRKTSAGRITSPETRARMSSAAQARETRRREAIHPEKLRRLREIRRLLVKGQGQRDVARTVGIPYPTVHGIANGRLYRGVA